MANMRRAGSSSDGRPYLERAKQLTASIPLERESELGWALLRLEKAIEAAETNQPLHRGHLPEEISDGLRDWLIGKGRWHLPI